MNIVIFGATGMVGRGVLLEALDSPDVDKVLIVSRYSSDVQHPKLRQLIQDDFEHFDTIADQLNGLDACFWCLGTTSVGLNEAAYTRITYDFTIAAAKVLYEKNPNLLFCFVSGAGTDSTERGRVMWARVKGKAENALKLFGFQQVVIFRPALIKPMRGCLPKGRFNRMMYTLFGFFAPLLRPFGMATSTVEVGRAMVAAGLGRSERQVLDSREINQLALKF
ncbi:MAG: NAD(P)H-binding protein [Rhodothermales bacterium]